MFPQSGTPLPVMIVLCFATLGPFGCRGDDNPCSRGELRTWRSAHFEYRSCDGDGEVCPAVLDELERHLEVMAGALGMAVADMAVPIRYTKHPRAPGFRGRYVIEDNHADVPQVFNAHELVHAYTLPNWGRAPSLLEEGVAEALGCSWLASHLADDWRTILNFDPIGQAWGIGYASGGKLVTHLLTEYDVVTFRELFRRANHPEDADAFAKLFFELYGDDLDEVWSAAMAQPAMCVPLWACSAPAAGTKAFSLGGTCEGSGERLLEHDGSELLVKTRGPGFRPLLCAPPYALGDGVNSLVVGGEQNFLSRWDVPEAESWLELSPGRYALTHYSQERIWDVSEVNLESPSTSFIGSNCADAKTITLAPDHATYLHVPRSNDRWAVRIAPVDPHSEFLVAWSPDLIEFCGDCDEACVRVQNGSRFTFNRPTVLEFVATALNGYWTVSFISTSLLD